MTVLGTHWHPGSSYTHVGDHEGHKNAIKRLNSFFLNSIKFHHLLYSFITTIIITL